MALEIFQLAQLTLNPLNDARSRSRLGVHLNGPCDKTILQSLMTKYHKEHLSYSVLPTLVLLLHHLSFDGPPLDMRCRVAIAIKRGMAVSGTNDTGAEGKVDLVDSSMKQKYLTA